MAQSKLERLPDKVLFKICEKILNSLEKKQLHWGHAYEWANVMDVYINTLKRIGMDYHTTDVDYLVNLISLNMEELDGKDSSVPLTRPKKRTYLIDVDVDERIRKTITYTHEFESYGGDEVDFPEELFRYLNDIGEIDKYDGKITDEYIKDSDTMDWTYTNLRKKN
jgi:hypothetical protein